MIYVGAPLPATRRFDPRSGGRILGGMSEFVSTAALTDARKTFERLRAAMRETIKGKDEVVEMVLICLAAGGHLLVEDLPGVGKTTLAYSLARSMDCAFSRIQFTSDLLPSDVTGVSIYDDAAKAFVFKRGPIFANIVLADEINRATPKTQSALLEVMDRARVTVDGVPHAVGSPFLVFATQNPVDYEGTFPLPESQMDRFLMRLHIGYPQVGDEMEILRSARIGYDAIQMRAVATSAEILAAQALVSQVYIEESVLEYLLKIVTATRTESEFRAGISVRGGLALRQAAQARALLLGRDFVLPDDIQELVGPVFGHRLGLARGSFDPREERPAVVSALKRIVGAIAIPN